MHILLQTLRQYSDFRAHFAGASHMNQIGSISVSRMDICLAWGEISQIISALGSFESKPGGVISTTRVDRT